MTLPDDPEAKAEAKVENGIRLVVIVVLGIPSIVWDGWVFKTLWGWFVAPVTGLPPLGLWEAVGLLITVFFMFFHWSAADYAAEQKLGRATSSASRLATSVLVATMSLVFGFGVHLLAT